MDYTRDELLEAKRQIGSTLHKLRATRQTLEGKEDPPAVSLTDHAGHPGGSRPSRLP